MRELVPTSTNQTKSSTTITYKVTISTADVADAGTKDNIKLLLIGENGEADLKVRNTLGLKKADSKEFDKITGKNVGTLKEVAVSLDNVRLRDKCFITVIEIVYEGTTYNIPVDDWVSVEPMKVAAKMESGLGMGFGFWVSLNFELLALQRNRQTLSYRVTVTTADERSAGTDANVKLTIYGSLGDSGKRPLEQRWRDLFERGQTDVFELSCLDMGELERIKLEHDNKMLKPDWKPAKVVITCNNK